MTAPRFQLVHPVDAPPAAVWEVLTDIAGTPQVLTGVEEVEILSDGPYAEGTRWLETRSMLGMTGTMELEVVEAEPLQRTVIRSAVGEIGYRTVFTLRELVGGDTELRLESVAELPLRRGPRALVDGASARFGLAASKPTMTQDLADIAAAAARRAR
ncbi:SRPBCC family protein [Brachybacterium paraconglomeratum]|uniref:SRPBCC family protein n=1 Tax=Brachybacterium paraconglomeratum TaxID=173362 RepID=UPI003FD2695D